MATIIPTNSGKWKAIIRRPGFGVRLKVRTFARKEDAEGWGRKTESEIERSVWRDVGDAERMTLGQVVESYEHDEVPKHDGADTEKAHLRMMKREPLMKLVIGRIDQGNIKALRDGWIKAGYAVATVNRRLTILHSAYEFARVDLKMRALENPVARMKLDGANKRERRVTEDEILALCEASDSASLGAYVRIAAETAMRRGELCKLQWSMVDLTSNVARLPGQITKSGKTHRFTKNGKPRDVPLSRAAVRALKGLKKRSEEEVTSAEKTNRSKTSKQVGDMVLSLKPHSVTQAMMRAIERARTRYVEQCAGKGGDADPRFLVDLHFHDLRHEATSRLAEVFNLHELMKITGQSDAKMLMRYYHPRAEDFARRMRTPKREVRALGRDRKKRVGMQRAASKR